MWCPECSKNKIYNTSKMCFKCESKLKRSNQNDKYTQTDEYKKACLVHKISIALIVLFISLFFIFGLILDCESCENGMDESVTAGIELLSFAVGIVGIVIAISSRKKRDKYVGESIDDQKEVAEQQFIVEMKDIMSEIHAVCEANKISYEEKEYFKTFKKLFDAAMEKYLSGWRNVLTTEGIDDESIISGAASTPYYIGKNGFYWLGERENCALNPVELFVTKRYDLKSLWKNGTSYSWLEYAGGPSNFDELEQIRNIISTCKQVLSIDTYSFYSKIDINDIKMFKLEGDIQYTSETTGSGGGVNTGGAIKGAIIAGAAGAIIGAREGQELVVDTYTRKHDSRVVSLYYTQDEKLIVDIISTKHTVDKVLKALRDKMPQKEESYILASQNGHTGNSDATKSAVGVKSSSEELKEYKAMLDEGLITQADYDAKKKQILGL